MRTHATLNRLLTHPKFEMDFFKVKVGFVFFSKPVRDIDLTLFHRDLCRIFVGQFSFQLPAIMTESDITDNRK